MNIITIFGRLTDNPELKTSQDGKSFANFTLADNRGKDNVSFFRCTAFGKTAELIAKSEKGHRLVVSGYMQEEKWTDQQTQQERRGWKTIVNEMTYIEPAPQNQAPAQQAQQYGQPQAGYSPQGQFPPQQQPVYPPQQGQYLPPQQPQGYPPQQNYGQPAQQQYGAPPMPPQGQYPQQQQYGAPPAGQAPQQYPPQQGQPQGQFPPQQQGLPLNGQLPF